MMIKTKNGSIGLETDINNYLTILPVLTFENKRIKTIDLFPIDLNFNNFQFKGLPKLADRDSFELIFQKLCYLEQPYSIKPVLYNDRILLVF